MTHYDLINALLRILEKYDCLDDDDIEAISLAIGIVKEYGGDLYQQAANMPKVYL